MKNEHWMILFLLAIAALIFGFRKPIQKLMTRGYINKNPGNIRLTVDTWKGEIEGKDKSFKTFKSMAWGYRALFVLLRTYNTKGLNTIRKIISVYAPLNENDTQSYITSVSRRTGIDPDEQIYFADENNIVNLVAAISYHENGISPDLKQIDEGLTLFKTA
jgi:hypothetical protein